MPYTVFALKWRPKSFDEVIGQNHIVATLKNAIVKNRLAHAYIFAGPRGVGKTSTARIFARALNCKNGPTVNPCGECPSCLDIAAGRGFDVIEIDGASNRGIDEVRVLRENVKFAPVGGKFKVYIIDEVHMLTTEAFNALLKTLEEPPEFVKFILATTQPNKVLPTILSRCLRMDFRRIPVREIIEQLGKILKGENIHADKDVLFAIARASDGSLRDAESLLDQLISFSKDKVALNDVISVLGVVEQEVLFELTGKIIHNDAKGALSVLNGIIDSGKDVTVFLNDFIEHFRNLMIAKVTKADPALIDLPNEVCQKLMEQSQDFSLEEIFASFSVLVNTQEMSKRMDSLRVPLEVCIVKLAHDKKPLAAGGVISQKASLSSVVSAEKKEIPVQNEETQAQDNASAVISIDNIKSAWQEVIKNLERIKISVATYLSEGEPLKVNGNTLIVAFPKNYSLHKESLEGKENRSLIETAISELMHTSLRVNFILSQEAKAKDSAKDSVYVKSALQMFGGRVIKED
jgi:DNA polymerase-3 subunit gamma/tau